MKKIILLFFISSLLILFFSYHFAYAKKIIPRIRVGKVNLGNKSYREGKEQLENFFNLYKEKPLVFVTPKERFEIPPLEIGFSYEASETAKKAYLRGREGNFFYTLGTKIKAFYSGIELDPAYNVNEEKLEQKITEIALKVDDPAVEASFSFKNGDLEILPAKEGVIVEREKLKGKILNKFLKFDFEKSLLPRKHVVPKISEEDLESVKPKVLEILKGKLKLSYKSKTWSPNSKQILSFLEYEKKDARTKIKLNETELKGYVEKIALEIYQNPRGEIFKMEKNRVVEFRPSQDGLELDRQKTFSLLKEALFDPSMLKTINLVVKVSPAPQSANQYGIRELLGEGTTNFKGSIRGRIHNIVTASSRLNGILIAPGETFSFNNALGEVSIATGYDMAYIIARGRTVLGAGGGVCQVSTTFFRAILNAGLPVLERVAHAYRVSYYEPPVGMDATVYPPAVDLRFKNDTSAYILVQTSWDLPNTSLTFRLYGTADGRKVEILGPTIHSQTPPPPPLYQEDPSLPKGTTKQIERANWGTSVTVKRKVTRGDEVLQEDTFFTRYQSWRAVFLVGSGE